MKEMKQPMTRCEFERRFNVLRERIRNGKMHFHRDAVRHTIASLTSVRSLPNGRIDFLSVNEMARLEANMTANFDDEKYLEMIKQQALKVNSNPSEDEAVE